MAYQILETNILQSAIKAAAQVTAALIQVGDDDAKSDPLGVMNTISDDLFAKLKEKADSDNKMLEADAAKSSPPRSSGYRSGGGSFGGGGGNVESDGSMKLSWGKFKGLTIAEIYELDEDAAGEYGYQKPGRAWVEWLAKNKDAKLGYSVKRAAAFLESKRS